MTCDLLGLPRLLVLSPEKKPLFADVSLSVCLSVFLSVCSMSLEHVVALPQDCVITEGQIGSTMYFIEAGEVRLAHPQLRCVRI